MWINAKNQTRYITHSDVRRAFPDVSMPSFLNDSILSSLGVYPVQPTPQPQFDPIAQRVVELPPIEVEGEWFQQWGVQTLTPEEVAANQAAAAQALQDSIVSSTQQRLDDFARTRNYDNILSACTYATSAVPKFAAEGQYAVQARDATWATLYQFMANVQAGTQPVPTGFEDVELLLPALEWPE